MLTGVFQCPYCYDTLRPRSKDHSELEMFDSQLRSAVCHITTSRLSDVQWLRASLRVKEGGLEG